MKKTLAIVMTLTVVSCATPRMFYWDSKVKELCEKDGGVTVFEHVVLSKNEYEKNDGNNGSIRVPVNKNLEKYGYYKKSNDIVINSSNPRVMRYEYDIYRKADDKLLGKAVSYSRSGGDVIVIDAGSSFSCADINSIRLDVEKQIFIIKYE